MRLLLVEDNPRLRTLLQETVHGAGWRLDGFGEAQAGAEAAAVIPYELALVDLGLPDGDGIDLVRSLRRTGFKAPILILTARGGVDDRIAGLDAGADDYLVKPFSHAELLARCRALLRRAPQGMEPTLEAGRLTTRTATRTVSCASREVQLTPRERALLEVLLRHAGRVVAKERLETALSEFNAEVSTNALELVVSRLRRKLDGVDGGVAVETIRGVGYLLRETAR